MNLTLTPILVLGWQRIIAVVLASVFIFSIETVYIDFLSPLYWYMGFTYREPDGVLFALSLAAAILPSTYLPIVCTSVKNFAEWVLYYVLYIPSVTVPILQGNLAVGDQGLLLLSVVLSFLIITAPARAHPFVAGSHKAPPKLSVTRPLFWTVFFSLYVGLTLYILVAFGSSLRLAGIADVYVQRFAANEVLDVSFVGYAASVLAGSLNPFLLAVGLWQRRPLFVALGVLGQVLVYSTAALRAVFLSIVFIPAFYFLLRTFKLNMNGIGLAFSSVAFGLMIAINAIDPSENFILNQIVSLIYLRTFCMTGALMGIYTEFFVTHPLTYYSHINAVSLFIPYPYGAQVGQEVGLFLMPGSVLFNANASFWATDGMAALGYVGIVIAGALFRVFILVVDAAIPRRVLPAACAAMVPTLVGVANFSLFTNLLSGGAALLILLFYYWTNLQEHQRAPRPAIATLSSV